MDWIPLKQKKPPKDIDILATFSDNKEYWIEVSQNDRGIISPHKKFGNCVAWMPLPKVYVEI